MKQLNHDDVEGHAIENDDEMKDEDLDETEMLNKYHTNDDDIDSDLYNQIQTLTRPSKEIKMMYSHPEEPVSPNEYIDGINWHMDKI